MFSCPVNLLYIQTGPATAPVSQTGKRSLVVVLMALQSSPDKRSPLCMQFHFTSSHFISIQTFVLQMRISKTKRDAELLWKALVVNQFVEQPRAQSLCSQLGRSTASFRGPDSCWVWDFKGPTCFGGWREPPPCAQSCWKMCIAGGKGR